MTTTLNKQMLQDLEEVIIRTYESGTTLDEAERLAARFLSAQMSVSSALRDLDLTARMAKSGVKAVRAAVYLSEVQKADKKPSDVLLAAIVDSDEIVSSEQTRLDTAEVDRDDLERYYNIFREAHIYYRGISKGRFGD